MGQIKEDEPEVDVTEVRAAMAILRGRKPSSGRAVVSASVLSPISEQMRKEEEDAAAATAAEKEASPEIGDQMQDGSVYAGLTADGTQRIFAMSKDLVTTTFNNASKAVKKLNADKNKNLGHDDWQIPTLENLRVLYKNQGEGKLRYTFQTVGNGSGPRSYWSSTENSLKRSRMENIRFSDGRWISDSKRGPELNCRPVRLVPVAAI
jgi:hypothetical protein